MTEKELEMLYESNDNFKEYVDRYCWKHNLTLDIALTHKIVQSTAEYYTAKL